MWELLQSERSWARKDGRAVEAVRRLACPAQCSSGQPQVAASNIVIFVVNFLWSSSRTTIGCCVLSTCFLSNYSKFLRESRYLTSSHLRISWPDATVQDLAYALRDGVLLCHTLHMIDPSTLDMKQVFGKPLFLTDVTVILQHSHFHKSFLDFHETIWCRKIWILKTTKLYHHFHPSSPTNWSLSLYITTFTTIK